MAFKMKGSSLYGAGNQSKSPGKMYDSPAKLMGLVKNKVNKELDTPAGKAMASAATGGAAKYASPAKNKSEESKEKMKETRDKDGSITKSKGGRSSTYKVTSRKKNKDGSTTIVRTNDQGNNDTRTQKPVS